MASELTQPEQTETSGRAKRRLPSRAAPPSSGRAMTVATLIYRELRADIVEMRRPPGEAISEKDIAQKHGVSRTPVREALLRLSNDGLLEIFPQSGTFVSRIPVQQLPEAIVIRRALEEAAARYAAEHATPRDMQNLADNISLQIRAAQAMDIYGFFDADDEFHALLAAASGYPGLWRQVQQVKVQVDRYRRLTLPVPGRMLSVIPEHQAIADAIAVRNGTAAAMAMREHMTFLQSSISALRDLNPDYFADFPREEDSDDL
jgi:GntR family transcriptional regulator, rspAB operon transcriptional repressor